MAKEKYRGLTVGGSSLVTTKEFIDNIAPGRYQNREGDPAKLAASVFTVAARYRLICDLDGRKIRKALSDGEINILLNYAQGAVFADVQRLPNQLIIAMDDTEKELYEMFEVDKPTLLEKLESFSIGEMIALIDHLQALAEKM